MGELKYRAFYDMAVSDLNAAKLLLDNKYYCQALYFFEQAVEKQVKFLGLTTGKISEKDSQNAIRHLPVKLFDKIFEQIYSSNTQFVSSNGVTINDMAEDRKRIKKLAYNAKVDKIKENIGYIKNMNNDVRVVGTLGYISEIVVGLEVRTRYPKCDGNGSPLNDYNADTLIVKELPYFIGEMKCVEGLILDICRRVEQRKSVDDKG